MNKRILITTYVTVYLLTHLSIYQAELELSDFLNFSVITDPKVRYYTREFNMLCPYTYLCNVQVDVDDSEFPCCGVCGCSNTCLQTMDCCPDKLPRLLTGEEVSSVYSNPLQCVESQFRPSQANRYNGKSYIMITKCADAYPDTVVIENCQKDYSEFDFETDLPDFLPVTNEITNITFKNKYCALCNYVSTSDLLIWEVKIGFGGRADDVPVRSFSDLNAMFAEDERSNAVFQTPSKLEDAYKRIKSCSIYIDKCNVTGQWMDYDADIESLCASYLSSYKGYKNVHCYLCNGFNASTVDQICEDIIMSWEPSSFLILLDFNNLEPEVKDEQDNFKERQCQKHQRYDTWAKLCRDLSCVEPTYLYDGHCKPAFMQLSEVSFDFTFRLIPIKGSIDVRVIPTLKKSLADDVERVFLASQSTDTVYSEVQMFLKLNDSSARQHEEESDLNYSPFKESVSQVAVRIMIHAREIYNLSRFLHEVTAHLNCLDFDITGGFIVEFANISFALFEKKLQEDSWELQEDSGEQSTATASSITPTVLVPSYSAMDYGLLYSYTDPLDGLRILPVEPDYFYFYPYYVRILPFVFCPSIMLEGKDFEIEPGRKRIYLINQKIYIKSSTVVFSENDSSIILCSDNYFSSFINKSMTPRASIKYQTEVILSIACTTASMCSLFLVFVTYCIYKNLRTTPGLNNMALTLSLFFAHLFYLTGGMIEIRQKWLCQTFGLLLHFSLLASFFWMAVCTFHMMKTFAFISHLSAIQNTKRKFVKYAGFVISSSLILVVANVVTSILDDSNIGYGGQTCYIQGKHMIIYTVAVPLGIVILSNLVMFLFVVIKVLRLPEVKKNTKHERKNIVIFAKLSTLTGLTWSFAYLYQWTEIQVFSYLFIVANASQGVFIMFSFIINRRVYNMMTSSYRKSSLYQMTHKMRTDSKTHTVRTNEMNMESNHM